MAIINQEETTKKPHPFSKEGRALREAAKAEETTPVTETQTDLSKLDLVIDRLNRLEAENAELKQKMIHPMVKAREKAEGPREFSYKLWGGIPVVSYVSKKKDATKDWVFKNQFGTYESNHLLVLTLATGDTLEVEVNEFNNNYVSSEKMTALNQHGEIITLENLAKAESFTFTTKDYGVFTVLKNMIN